MMIVYFFFMGSDPKVVNSNQKDMSISRMDMCFDFPNLHHIENEDFPVC